MPNIRTGFTPSMRLQALNLEDPNVRDGLWLSLELFSRMNELSKQKNVDFLVWLIPTKESVLSEFIEHSNKLPSFDTIEKLLNKELRVNQLARNYFVDHGIAFFDLQEPLRKAVSRAVISK